MSRDARKRVFGFPTRADTNRPVQSQRQAIARSLKFWIKEEEKLYYPCILLKSQRQAIARSLKFWIKEEEKLYYPCSEDKGTDQHRSDNDQLRSRSHCEVDVRHCFSHRQTESGFLMTRLIKFDMSHLCWHI